MRFYKVQIHGWQMTAIKDSNYKKALLVELFEVYVSKGHSIPMLVGKD